MDSINSAKHQVVDSKRSFPERGEIAKTDLDEVEIVMRWQLGNSYPISLVAPNVVSRDASLGGNT